jgi:carnitine monooxygenase subunit
MQSSGFAGMILSDLEAGVRSYHDQLRRIIPVMSLEEQPPAGRLAHIDSALLAERNADGWERDSHPT